MTAKPARRIARGQRVMKEVVFEPDPEMVARVRHVQRPVGTLVEDVHPADRTLSSAATRNTDIASPVDTPSVWEAREQDDED